MRVEQKLKIHRHDGFLSVYMCLVPGGKHRKVIIYSILW